MTNKLAIGPIMLDIQGLTLDAVDKEKLNHPNTGAIILFSRNYQDPEQVTELIKNIRAARNGDILISVDQEGGRVQRFQQGFTRLPPAARFLDAPDLAKPAGWLMAAELLAVGVDFSFAPVLDIDCGVSEIIGNRSFATHPAQATKLASDFRNGMNEAGMAATGKHFPGHGAVALDSHLTLPIDDRDLDAIRAKDLLPFKQLIAEGLEGIMPAHVLYPQIDPNPAGFSKFWLQDILRKELAFDGVIFSDDLSMEGAASVGDFPTRAKLAQQAGCDMILVCNNAAAAEQVLESLPVTKNPVREQRLKRMQGKPALNREQLLRTEKWQQFSNLINSLN
ncbi:MAG: beta-N-acetylhexosaminidase [Methylococcaceae bacterium]|nr:beta-N-acetylhexosaminidase [Methylococcaceae bacterium]MDZ4156680.1 beta-N-acetylhexosaminidase [Methylococcales bacterium]MDP2394830.1 beta-N-acetylhexosaminidase [Methylococcaceae bacterium]MDP3020251.1 beta-N-acetylhexosaminidase [Methylococcaceae bacterium]MDP3390792.1 beta-N-acetylhexosaminidase [Methylococcaceae bacterium]